MRIAVVAHSITDFYFSPQRMSALGALSLCRALEQAGESPVLCNLTSAEGKPQEAPYPIQLEYLKPHLIPDEYGPLSFFTRCRRLGPAPRESARIVLDTHPDTVWISCFAFAYLDDALDLAEELKQACPALPIALGGAGPSADPGYCFSREIAPDWVCTGEAEPLFDELLYLTRARMTGRELIPRNPHIHTRRPLGRMPGKIEAAPRFCPVETMIPAAAVLMLPHGTIRISLMLSRGCPKRCAFCSNFLSQGREFRTYPLAELRKLIDRLDLPTRKTGKPASLQISFEDDNFLLDRDNFFSAIELLRTRFPGATFSAENGIDYLLLDEGTIDAMLAAGFTQFNLSAGSLDAAALSAQRRGFDERKLTAVLDRIRSGGGSAILYVIAGLREDTPSSTAGMLLKFLELPADIGISPFYAVPGLPGFEPETGYDDEKRTASSGTARYRGSSLYPWNGSLSTAELATAFRLARLVNLLKHPERDPALAAAVLEQDKLHTRRRRNGNKPVPLQPPVIDQNLNDLFFAGLGRMNVSHSKLNRP